MGDENFCLFGGKLCETVFDGIETFLQNVELFVAFISVVAVVVWGQSKAKYEMVFIFKFDIIEQIYIRNVGDVIRESAGFGKNTAMFGVVAEIVVVAEADADRSDGAEMFEPRFEAGALGRSVDGVLVVDKIASDDDEAWLVGFGAAENGLEARGNTVIKMNIAQQKNLVFSLFGLIETVVSRVERFHQHNYTSYGIFFKIFETCRTEENSLC